MKNSVVSLQNSPLPGAGLIKYTVEQAFKLFSATEKEDLEKIRKDIQELKLALNSHLPEAAEEALLEKISSKQEILDGNIR